MSSEHSQGPAFTSTSHEESKESLYAILNLPVSASQDEIRHRFKELAVIFHPDRQLHKDEHSVKLAEARFVQIQRAHDILIDPMQRQIYDTLGEEGLLASKALQHRASSTEELRAELQRLVNRSKQNASTGNFVTSHSSVSFAYDATDVFASGHLPGWQGVQSRLQSINHTALILENTTGVQLRTGTDATLTARIQSFPSNRPSQRSVIGTIRHQYSPRIAFQAAADLYRLKKLDIETTYTDNDTNVTLKADVHPYLLVAFPRLSLDIQRRLFPDALTTGVVGISTRRRFPSFEVMLLAPLEADKIVAWQSGVRFTPLPSLVAEFSTKPLTGGLKGRVNLDYSLRGLAGTVYGIWSGPRNTKVSVAVGASAQGPIYTDISISLSGHRLHIPIVLSYEIDVMIGMCALLVPSALAATAHSLILKPWFRTRRLAQIKETRRLNHDHIERRRQEAQESSEILLDSARRRMERERSIGGLVIVAATYAAIEEEEENGDSEGDNGAPTVDVTVALQAQVHDSKLMIPGGRSKMGLLGFYDPSPGARKRLRIEYLFHNMLHVVEVGDFTAVVLPLRAHLRE